jgi:integrase/recombinase XerD
VPTPKFEEKPVEPFSKEDIELVLKACDYCVDAHPENRRRFTMRRCAANRDHAIILTLLDTGLRASELCALKVGDAEMKTGKLEVKHGVLGGAKGRKGRAVFLGKATRRAVWRHLTGREDGEDQKAPLILNRGHRPFHADTLRILVTRIGRRAGVKDAHPHKFRHYAEFRTMPS